MKRQLFRFIYAVALALYILNSEQKVLSLCSVMMINRNKLSNYIPHSTALYSTTKNIPLDTTGIIYEKHEHYMRLALRHAQHSFREKEVPIGAVIVDKDGTVLATSRNQVETDNDVTSHAEITCIRKAAQIKKNWRLSDCTLYSTLEPCPMCMGAIQASRITKVVYGASDHRMGACGSWVDLVSAKHPFHTVEVIGGLLKEESGTLLKRFFQIRRREAASEKFILDVNSDNDIDSNVQNDTNSDDSNHNSSSFDSNNTNIDSITDICLDLDRGSSFS